MSAAQGLILGLTVIAFLVNRLSVNFEEKKDKIHKSLMALSVLMIAAMEYTAIGIAEANSYSNAANAYLFALLVTVLVFLGMMYKIVMQMKDEAQNQSKMTGLGEK